MMFKNKFNGVRKTAGVMNSTEGKYATYLEGLLTAGHIEAYHYEGVKFKVYDGSWYCPDFMVICQDHIEFHEVKGSYMLDRLGHSKFKQAADEHPHYRWVMQVWRGNKVGFEKVYDNINAT